MESKVKDKLQAVMETEAASSDLLEETWNMVFEEVRKVVEIPIVWLAMQEVKPLTIEGNQFVAGLPSESYYLSINLQVTLTRVAIEEALKTVVGRPLEFHLVEGTTIEAWQAEKERRSAVTPQAFQTIPRAALGRNTLEPPESLIAPPASGTRFKAVQTPTREVMQNWDKLHDHLMHRYKVAPSIRYPHGQARFVMDCVQYISDTMDLLMPTYTSKPDPNNERNLARELERLGSAINLDPLFLALELLRYRTSIGKDIGLS